MEQVRALASRLANVPIDVLVNNAGVYNDRGVCAPEDDACAGDWTTQNFGKMRYELLDTILSVNVKDRCSSRRCCSRTSRPAH